jgi:hypothetical protein
VSQPSPPTQNSGPAGEHLNDLLETAFPVDEDLFEINAQGEEPQTNISLSPFFEEEGKAKAPEPRVIKDNRDVIARELGIPRWSPEVFSFAEEKKYLNPIAAYLDLHAL